ncbi:MAG: Gfo/Idh/MocA family oxidoreductase [Candidatus Hydrogenedentes bacterium]|nr:Gfo/Idh/MocA family oxidoreductase [Candidatus Hydrogenedentota bacterium]
MRNFTRRDFMRQSSMTLAASTLAGTVMPRAVSANDKIVIGAIGVGGMGRGDLATFLHNSDVECAVVCDVDDKQTAEAARMVEGKRGKAPDLEKDFRRVIDRKDIDAVLVATPDHWHALPTIYACQTGKDVYCEKPLGASIDEGRAMVEAARENKRVVQMGTQWRSGTHYRDAVEFIQSGKIGKVRLVRAWAYLDWIGGVGTPADCNPPAGVDYDTWLGPAPLRPFNPNRFHFNFRWYWDYAGGLMTDWGVHLLNICQWAMGPEMPKRVSSTGGRYVVNDNTETPDTQIAIYEFSEYSLIFEQQMVGGLGPGGKPHGMLFCGTEGTVIIDEGGWQFIPEPKKKEHEAYKAPSGDDARPAHVRNFLDCMKTREKTVMDFSIGHFVSTVAHLGNLAYRTGSEIHWDAENEKVIDNDAADVLVSYPYRDPWKLPYSRRQT